MLTRREEDIVILEIEEKNTELLAEWVEGKEGNRNAKRTANGQVTGERSAPEGSEQTYGNVSA